MLLGCTTTRAAAPLLEPLVPAGLAERFRPPPGLQWSAFTSAAGASLRYCHVEPRSPAIGTIVIADGFSE